MADDTRDLQERRVVVSEQRESRFQRGSRRSWTSSATGVYRGNGMLAAMLLVGIALVAVRLVADFEVQEGGAVKGNVLHPKGQYGPIAILAGLLASFFVLSFVAMGGGTRAKLAVIMGGCIILTLGVRSLSEIEKIGSTFGSIGQISVPQASGTLPDIYGNTGSAGSSGLGTGPVAAASSPGEAVSASLLGAPSANAYSADVRALENLNLVKVVGDSVTFVGDATASVAKKALSALGL